MSMTAPGQMDRARDAALRAASAAPGSHALALIGFGDAATVIVEPTTDRSAIVAAISQLRANATGTRSRTQLAQGERKSSATREGHVVVVTDLQQSGWESNDDGGLPDGVGLDVIGVPPPTGNLAITSAERARSPRIVASIQNYSNGEVRAPVAPDRRRQGNREG